jgi:prepilin-type N-terminal cleavage/methylation domain-containing protein/prepilin-type processing-associated H-X9-DG protein
MVNPNRKYRIGDLSMTRKCKAGFTLVELLVVIAIIGILVALLLPAIQAAREAARRSQCVNNLKQIAIGIELYHASHKEYPSGRKGCDGWGFGKCADGDPIDIRAPSGLITILPFVEQQALFERFDFNDGPWTPKNWPEHFKRNSHDTNTFAVGSIVPFYSCPSDPKEPLADHRADLEATGSYAFSMGSNGPSFGIDTLTVKMDNNGMFMYNRNITIQEVTDGTSNTLYLGETINGHEKETSNRWSAASRHLDSLRSTDNPMNTPVGQGITINLYGYKTNGSFASAHPGGAQFSFGDGHGIFLSETIELQVYHALSTRNLGEVIDSY